MTVTTVTAVLNGIRFLVFTWRHLFQLNDTTGIPGTITGTITGAITSTITSTVIAVLGMIQVRGAIRRVLVMRRQMLQGSFQFAVAIIARRHQLEYQQCGQHKAKQFDRTGFQHEISDRWSRGEFRLKQIAPNPTKRWQHPVPAISMKSMVPMLLQVR